MLPGTDGKGLAKETTEGTVKLPGKQKVALRMTFAVKGSCYGGAK